MWNLVNCFIKSEASLRAPPFEPSTDSMFAWLISHQPTVLFSQNKPATSCARLFVHGLGRRGLHWPSCWVPVMSWPPRRRFCCGLCCAANSRWWYAPTICSAKCMMWAFCWMLRAIQMVVIYGSSSEDALPCMRGLLFAYPKSRLAIAIMLSTDKTGPVTV
jgi:hypothetical protein